MEGLILHDFEEEVIGTLASKDPIPEEVCTLWRKYLLSLKDNQIPDIQDFFFEYIENDFQYIDIIYNNFYQPKT